MNHEQATIERRRGAGWACILGAALGFVLGCSNGERAQEAAPVPPAPVPPAPLSAEQQAEYTRAIDATRALLDKGDASAGLNLLKRAEQLQPNAFAVHNNYCVAYGILQRRDEAVASCQRALQLDPTSQLAKNNLAWVSGITPIAKAQ